MSMTWTINCPDCGMVYVVGKRCACFPPLPAVRPSGRRPKGSVKDVVLQAYDKKMTVPQAAKASGISAWTIYNAATRLGIKLKKAR